MRLSDGQFRYSVPVSVGGAPPIMAMLDTGSFGLRVMGRTLAQKNYSATSLAREYGYGSGVVLHGPLAHAVVAVGPVTTEAPIFIQVIESVACRSAVPVCAASRLSPADYKIGGNGLTREGFEAIIGVSMALPATPEAAINPLAFIGDRAWIVILPRPTDKKPGRLIVNPSASDRQGFRIAPAPHSATELPAALTGGSAMVMDSGAGKGLAPFFRYAILFDLKDRTIGVKQRRVDD
jgi:hypothetical protein